MPELLGAHGGGYAGTFVEVGGVCPNLCGRRGGGYAGSFVGLPGVCRKFLGLRGGYAGTFGGSGGGMPELLWA